MPLPTDALGPGADREAAPTGREIQDLDLSGQSRPDCEPAPYVVRNRIAEHRHAWSPGDQGNRPIEHAGCAKNRDGDRPTLELHTHRARLVEREADRHEGERRDDRDAPANDPAAI